MTQIPTTPELTLSVLQKAGYRFSDEEIMPYYQQWAQNPSPKTMDALVGKIKPILNYAADFASGGAAPESLRLHAKRLAISALKTYDPSKGSLVNHLMINLRRLQRIGPKVKQVIPIPERVRLDLSILNQAEKELQEKLGREPSTAELADYTGLSVRRIEKIRSSVIRSMPQSHAIVQTEEGMGELPTAPITEDKQSSELLEYLYMDANPREQLILEHYYGLHGKKRLPMSEIAKKLRCSTATVSRQIQQLEERLGKWAEYTHAGLFRRPYAGQQR